MRAVAAVETARDGARDEIQNIVDLLPDGSVDHVEDPIPNGFVSCGDGKQYTGRWRVYLADPTNVEDAVRDLRRDAAAAGLVEDEDLDNRDDRFGSRRDGDEEPPLIGVAVAEDLGGIANVQIMAFARCSQAPPSRD